MPGRDRRMTVPEHHGAGLEARVLGTCRHVKPAAVFPQNTCVYALTELQRKGSRPVTIPSVQLYRGQLASPASPFPVTSPRRRAGGRREAALPAGGRRPLSSAASQAPSPAASTRSGSGPQAPPGSARRCRPRRSNGRLTAPARP